MKSLKKNIYFKLASILVIVLLLLIPVSRIKSLILEREGRQQEAIIEVSSKWAGQQTLTGPILSIPYQKARKEISADGNTERVFVTTEYIHILPASLVIDGEINPQRRNRGIFEIVVYNAELKIEGVFDKPDLSEYAVPLSDIQFDKASLNVGISDLRGIEDQVSLTWNNQQYIFDPGLTSNDVLISGINTQVEFDPESTRQYAFSFTLRLRGSQQMYFTPVGKVTEVHLSSPWENPGFDGAFLPDPRQVTAQGFNASWKVLHLNRNFPQMWSGSKHSVQNSSFGLNLLLPVDHYMKSFRTVKYAILMIGFTFLVFFFIEVLNKIFIHPVQYILVGMALIVFYTLLLSISEHLNFNLAFVISAMATLSLVAMYVKAIFKSPLLTAVICGILLVLYGFVFVIIQLQDYALLIGSVGIFVILALVMYFSRKIDWYDLNLEGKETSEVKSS